MKFGAFKMKITVAGVGYVGLSLAVLLAQKHDVTAITTTESKAEKLNHLISPIQDDEIERFLKRLVKVNENFILIQLLIRKLHIRMQILLL